MAHTSSLVCRLYQGVSGLLLPPSPRHSSICLVALLMPKYMAQILSVFGLIGHPVRGNVLSSALPLYPKAWVIIGGYSWDTSGSSFALQTQASPTSQNTNAETGLSFCLLFEVLWEKYWAWRHPAVML